MVATIPPLLIEKPTPTFPLRYGLLQAAVGPFDLPVHARNGGLRYVTSICADGFGYDIACIGATASKTASFVAGSTTVTGTPFIIYATMTCGTVGYTYEEQRAMVVERLKSVEQAVLEDIFSQSSNGQAPGLIAADGIANPVVLIAVKGVLTRTTAIRTWRSQPFFSARVAVVVWTVPARW